MKTTNYKIVLIGAGNVATQLGHALKNSKCTIVQVFSKHINSASRLAKLLKCDYTNSTEYLNLTADIYIIAVNDDAISTVVNQLQLKNKIVVHTSGSVEMALLKSASKNYGVFYPLQTFSIGAEVNFKTIPICIEASNSGTLIILLSLASSISNNVQKINSEQRKVIHLAAVFACNFSNHLYSIAETILASNHLSLDILKPLIEVTAKKIQHHSPAEMQTGPAIRNDKKTMNNHLTMLSEQKKYQQLYKLISKSIIDSAKEKK